MADQIRMQCTIACFNQVWTLLSSMFFCISGFAQTNNSYFFRHIAQQDGLAHDNVYAITQDKRGFIWMATQNGLQRYDGTRFVSFRDMLNNPLQSAQGQVTLFADKKKGLLWLSNKVNTERVNLTDNSFTTFNPEEQLQQSPGSYQQYEDQDRYPWMIGNNAIFSFNYITKKFLFSSFNGNVIARGVSNTFVTDNTTGQTWMGGNSEGLILFDDKTKKVYTTSYNPVNNPVLLAFQRQFCKQKYPISKIMLDSHGNLWVATWSHAFFKFDAASRQLISYSLTSYLDKGKHVESDIAPIAVTSFYEDNHGVIWVCTEGAGLLRFNDSAGKFESILIDAKNTVRPLYDYNIYCIFQDKQENIWLGTNKGIWLLNPYRQFFRTVHHTESNKASLPGSEIESCIQASSGNILVGTWGGGITLFDNKWNYKRNYHFKGPPELNLVWSFIENDDGNIWAGCQHGYIHIYDTATQNIQTIHPAELYNATIRCMAKDKAGNIWFGLHNGRIAKWNKTDNKFYGYNTNAAKKDAVYAPVTSLFFDDQGRCWAATDNGFAEFDTGLMAISKTYRPDKNQLQGISAAVIRGVAQYNDSTLIIASAYGGVNLFNIKAQIFTQAPFSVGLMPNSVYAVRKDTAGIIWFTTDYGLYAFSPATNRLVSYHFESGVLNAAFKNTGFYSLQDGTWATSTSTEILSFQPGRALTTSNETPVEITGVKVFETPVQVDSLQKLNEPLRLPYNQNFLTIEWSRPDFFAAHRNQYFYRLQDVNNDWINAGEKAFAIYTNLVPGSYTFEVKAGEGTDFTDVKVLHIVITPPFWRTWWFLSVMVLAATIILYLLVRWRINGLRAIEREKIKVQEARIEVLSMNEKLSLARLEALRSQMNPHFIFNCLTSIDNLIETGEREKAVSYLAKFAKLIRSILETSKLNSVACWKDIEMLKMYLEMEALRCDDKFIYAVNVSEEILQGDYKVPPLVIQPFVENAIHHGLLNKKDPDKEVVIDVSVEKNCVHYIIHDNGVGRVRAQEYQQINRATHQSMGMQMTVDRIELFNKNSAVAVIITDLYTSEQRPAGTRVDVRLENQT